MDTCYSGWLVVCYGEVAQLELSSRFSAVGSTVSSSISPFILSHPFLYQQRVHRRWNVPAGPTTARSFHVISPPPPPVAPGIFLLFSFLPFCPPQFNVKSLTTLGQFCPFPILFLSPLSTHRLDHMRLMKFHILFFK